jgi:hypothetical protein
MIHHERSLTIDAAPAAVWDERAGRASARLKNLERTNDIQRQMLDAAARRPRSRDDLVERLRKGRF